MFLHRATEKFYLKNVHELDILFYRLYNNNTSKQYAPLRIMSANIEVCALQISGFDEILPPAGTANTKWRILLMKELVPASIGSFFISYN